MCHVKVRTLVPSVRCRADGRDSESILAIDNRVKDIARGVWRIETDSRLDDIIGMIKTLKDQVKRQDQDQPASADYVSSICAGFSKLSLETQVFEKEARILATLNYNDRTARHEKVPVAHFTTFKWSLRKTEETEEEYGRLRHWLEADDALFWVSGKPGSGKSTFMKSIADSEDMRKLLEVWAGTNELLIISHYFTIYGTPIQRSLEGLLRSLVFGILSLKPTLIPKLLADRWQGPGEESGRTQSELEALLRHFGAETESLPSKICYFIDGLDEFEGDHLDICQTLKQLSQSPFIKVCVSSRPWNVFEDALGAKSSSKLYIHELTRGDIRNYTESSLEEHPRWNILQEEAGHASSRSLVDDVVLKSNGVFLWVTLVVRLLREGLTNDDSLFDLQKRLSSLPADLEEFFRHIIQTVDHFYNKRMATTLSLALKAQEPLCLEIYSFLDREDDESENYAFEETTALMTTDILALNKLFGVLSRRINGRCKGLLERNGDRMEFLHRTVYDFLRTNEMSSFLRSQLKVSHNPSLSLLKAFIAWIKRSVFSCTRGALDGPLSEISGFVNRLRQALQYARRSETLGESSKVLTAALLDNMEHSITLMLSRGQIEMTDPSFARDVFRQLVLEVGVGGYIHNKLMSDPRFFMCQYADKYQSPLHVILNSSCKLTEEDKDWVLNKLLESGHSPEQLPSDCRSSQKLGSPWEYLLSQYTLGYGPDWIDTLLACIESKIPLALLNHGADPTITVPGFVTRASAFDIFFYAIARVWLFKRPEVYEETIVAMLNSPKLRSEMVFGDFLNEFPCETRMNNEDFLVRIFVLVLSKLAFGPYACIQAECLMRPVLSAEGYNKLIATVNSTRTKKRHAKQDQEDIPGKRKKRAARKRRKG